MTHITEEPGKGGDALKGILNDQNLIYQQIAQLLEDGILRGDYPADTPVPSTNELARAFNINPATAAKGVNRLVEEGLLYKRRGVGMFVAPGALQALRKKTAGGFRPDHGSRPGAGSKAPGHDAGRTVQPG